jgi:hypothetical protein
MTELTDRRGISRIGVVICALVAMLVALGLGGPGHPLAFGEGGLVWWLVMALIGGTGVGLLLRVWPARVAGVVFFLILVALTVNDLAKLFLGTRPWSPDLLVHVVNPVASSFLLIWLCVRGILVLLDRARPGSLATARVVGAFLVVVAVDHLRIAATMDSVPPDVWSIQFSPRGTAMIGFPGWPIWQVALLLVGGALLFGPRRVLRHAAAGLMLLLALLAPLVLFASLKTPIIAIELAVVVAWLIALAVYLAWWLRDGVRAGLRSG